MEQIVMPDLYCPFASAVNKHTAAIQEESMWWVSFFGLLPDERSHRSFRAAAISKLAGRFHPFTGREELRLISDFYCWMFLQDDRRDESEVGWRPDSLSEDDRRSLQVLKGDDPTWRDPPSVYALRNLRDRLNTRAPGPGWMRRFFRSVESYFAATTWEATNRARGIVPDFGTYVRMRPLTAGLALDDELIELAEEAHLFGGAREHPTVRSLTLASHRAICWANDLVSLEKELAHSDVHNLVLVLLHTEGLGLQEAVDRAAQMHDVEVRAFMRFSSRLPSFGRAIDGQLGRYVVALQARMRGNLDWAHESARYWRTAQKKAGGGL